MQQIIYAIILAFALTLVFGVPIIPALRRLKVGQHVRGEGPKTHYKKEGTPTMGGIIFLIPLALSSLILARHSLDYIVVAVVVTLAFGLIGFLDDYIKIVKKRSLGLKAYQKIIAQIGVAVIFALYAYNNPNVGSKIYIPFSQTEWDLGVWYVPFIVFVIIGTVNSTNLTDGLDGLAAGVTLVVSSAFSIIAYFAGSKAMDEGLAYLGANYQNLAVFAGALLGACMGFLKYNAYPAQVFMGDTGSIGIGGAIVALAVLLKIPLFLPILGGVYMIEAISVIIQVVSFKKTGKRVFKMAPLHHHFELKGIHETKVVTMFIMAAIVLCLVGLLAV